MERRIEYLEKNESTPPADLARARLELADWMIATHSRSDFVEVFTNAYTEYVASGASAEEIDTIFHPPLPVEVPTFLIRPHSRLSLGIPVEAALQYRGYIDVPERGIYSFYLTSDDGSALYIDGKKVINNDGLHSAVERSGEVALEKGLHHFALNFIEGGGGYTLRLLYGLKQAQPQNIPVEIFKVEKQ